MLPRTFRLLPPPLLMSILLCLGLSNARAAPDLSHHSDAAASDPLVACIVETLDVRKAEELGTYVAASGSKWVKSPSGGMSDPYILKNSDLRDPNERKQFSAANSANEVITNALTTGADKCGVDDDEFEQAIGVMLGLENGMFRDDWTKSFSNRVQKVVAAFMTIRKTLLNSQEFQQSYRRAVRERDALKK